ncbi:MAG: hypothetical protein RLZZ371_1909 [Pseudomonadota bacterium]
MPSPQGMCGDFRVNSMLAGCTESLKKLLSEPVCKTAVVVKLVDTLS